MQIRNYISSFFLLFLVLQSFSLAIVCSLFLVFNYSGCPAIPRINLIIEHISNIQFNSFVFNSFNIKLSSTRGLNSVSCDDGLYMSNVHCIYITCLNNGKLHAIENKNCLKNLTCSSKTW